ncbi:hypothetical protein GDO81_001063 [Engystomops pustulosus]|uniref:Maturase K n=1 Tax=Engystomops pustulosus TaxID=76066 RepID=A0AAV7DAD7_ENGPU|nr:hypothetical protein GDO81_001063 [Engystomops pustulosus]
MLMTLFSSLEMERCSIQFIPQHIVEILYYKHGLLPSLIHKFQQFFRNYKIKRGQNINKCQSTPDTKQKSLKKAKSPFLIEERAFNLKVYGSIDED